MSEPRTLTLNAPGASLRYDVRDAEAETTKPVLLMVGAPMDAGGFTALAERFPDRTGVTYDPRGVGRSQRSDGAHWATPEEHADDLHRLIAALNAGPVDIFASSGGAVTALVLVARHPEQVHTLVAHEPPAAQAVPDREQALATSAGIHETYEREGFGPAMAKFIAFTMVTGPIPADYARQPPPNPAAFGLPAQDDGSRDHPLLGPHMIASTGYEHDFAALTAAPTRIVMAAGAQTEGQMAHRAAVAIAERLGTEVVIFPGGHTGFAGAEAGMPGDPQAFAATLRRVLDEEGVRGD